MQPRNVWWVFKPSWKRSTELYNDEEMWGEEGENFKAYSTVCTKKELS